MTILCPYDTAGLSSEVLDDAAATHPTVIDSTGQRPSGDYAPDRIIADYNRPLPPPPAAAAFTTVERGLLSAVRLFAAGYGRHLGLSEDRVDDVVLAVSELAANSVAHGNGHGTVHLWTDDHHLVCQVADNGHITDPLAGRLPVQASQLNGRGLLLINHVADLVRVHSTPMGITTQIRFALVAR